MADQIKVYVRLCYEGDDPPCRELSFRYPAAVSQDDLLSWGFAIDGNQAVMQVTSGVDPRHGEFVSLAAMLHDEQVDLKEKLGERGYEVVFA